MENNLLQSILSDPQALQSAIEMAAGMLQSPPDKSETPPVSNHASSSLSGIFSRGETTVCREKRTLLNAVKPFVASDIGTEFDHALRLVSIAQMARSALGEIGKSAAGTKGRDDSLV